MKEKLFWSVVSLIVVGVKLVAQSVGISTTVITPDPSAMLEVRATDKGLLIPRVALVQTTSSAPITNPAVSLLVYNTATVNDVTPGFYYWDGSQWIRLSTGSGSLPSWYLSGNVASPTDFIGTTNAQDFRVYTNNTEKLRVTTAGNVGIGTTTPAERLDVNGNVRFNGALMPNGDAGTAGMFLKSQGAGTFPIWGWALTKDNVYAAFSTATVNLDGNTWKTIAGPINVTLSAGDKVIAYASGCAIPSGVCYASADLRISVNGNDLPEGGYTGETVDYDTPWDFRESYAIVGYYVAPANGTYAFRLEGWGPANPSSSGCYLQVGGDNTTFTQATLVVIVLK